jgi:protein-S-isoprenylcysteine O-methyltransferase Ste14
MTVAQSARTPAIGAVVYEAIAWVAPVLLFGLLTVMRVVAFVRHDDYVALLNGVGLAVLNSVFVLRKPPKEVDRSFRALAMALGGNFLPFFLILTDRNHWLGSIPLAIQVVTLLLAIWTVLSLRRSMGITPANRGIKTGGPYRFIRHPLYACVIASQLGLFLEYPSVMNACIIVVTVLFKAMMIRNEERILRRDPDYQAYMSRVTHRVVPGLI